MRITVRDIHAEPAFPGKEARVDLEQVLPLEMIREHTKTDDTPSVSDAQLSLYRQAAFEACELYTGLIFTHSKVVREPVASEYKRGFRRVRKHRLKYAPVDGVIYLYGGGLLQPVPVYVTENGREITIPILQEALDASSCCNPCSMGGENFGIKAMYLTGISCADDVPAIAKMGCLKYIAWAVQNPGDVIMTVRNRAGSGEAGIVGTNNGAWASGAIEEWRQLKVDA